MMMICSDIEQLATEIEAEVFRAREKFPTGSNLGWALIEEVGELAKAVLHQEPRFGQRKEAIQIMAVCYRIITEGDASLDLSDEAKQK